ncbi:MAG: nucleoside monophosphate kinase [Patescibacteria group bacterium]
MINTFIFMGRPGSGKGVQSALLSEKLSLPVFSTGNRVRETAKADHKLGKKIKEVSESGGLTPFWFASFLFQEALFTKKDGEGMIFEGVGRKEPEAKLFHEVHEFLESDYRVIYLNVSPETVIKRLLKRGETEGRADDNPESIKIRLENFEKETRPAIEFFRSVGKVIEIDGEPLPEVVAEAVMQKLNAI